MHTWTPFFKGSIAGLLRYAREVWLASSTLNQQMDVMTPQRLEGLAQAVLGMRGDSQGVNPSIFGGLDVLGWTLRGSSTIVAGPGQRWGEIDFTITPPKLLAKLVVKV